MSDARKTKRELLVELAGLREQLARATGPADGPDRLGEADRQMALLLGSVTEHVIFHDPSMHIVWTSRAAAESVNLTPDQLKGRRCFEVWQGRDAPCEGCPILATLRTGVHHAAEMATPNGRVWDVRGYPVHAENGALLGAVEATLDITDRKRVEEALRHSEATYRALIEASPDAVAAADPEFRLVAASDRAYAMFGYAKDDTVLGRNIVEFFRPADMPRLKENFGRTLHEGLTRHIEYHLVRKDGSEFLGEISAAAVRDADGNIQGLIATIRDITKRRRAEEALRQSEANYRAIFNAVSDIVFVDDIETGEVVDMNQRAVEAYGYGLDELDALNAAFRSRSDAPYSRQSERECMRRAAEEGPQLVEWLARDRRGREFWVEVSVRRATIGGRERLLSVLRDITDRKRAEEALRKSEEDYRLLFEQSLDGILVAADGRIVRANRALADMVGEPPDRLIGRSALDLLHPDDREAAADYVRGVLAGDPPSPVPRRYRSLRADGSSGLVEIRSRPIRWEGHTAVQSLYRDVTRQVHLEEQLQQAMKMEAVGQLAGGIAHDFNNLMTGILCHAGLLKSEPAAPEAVRETADLIEGAARRAAQLTSQLLGFARRGKQQDVPVDLVATVNTSVRLLSRSLAPPIRIRTDFRHSPAYVRGDPVQMEQVVLNLAMNARDAMPDGGDITFALDHALVQEHDDRRPPHARAGRYVVLSVTDTGCGIPGNLHDRVFEPFFTTKPQGKGTGMGLAMVYGIVRNHGGWIDIESAPNAGATFRVFLSEVWIPSGPAVDAPAEAEPAPAPVHARRSPAADTPATGRILVIDDEAIVRDVLERMLTKRGYEVVTAAGAAEAIAYYHEAAKTVALAIIDLRMPGMDGRECFQILKAIHPGIRAILATGGGPEVSVQDLLDDGVVTLIQKPFEADQLDEAIRKALAP